MEIPCPGGGELPQRVDSVMEKSVLPVQPML
jgi:hypothetical protein